MSEMDSRQLASLACKVLSDRKASDIRVIDIHEVSVIADYFIIASISNTKQMQAVIDHVDEALGRAGYPSKQIEGSRNSSWILMDFGDIVLHLFDEENRIYYDLERIWRDGRQIEVRDLEK